MSKPNEIVDFSKSKLFYSELLYTKLKGLFEIDCPDWWDKDAILRGLLKNGVLCFFKTGIDVYALPCSLSGQNVFYKPNYCLIANPYLPKIFSKFYKIGKQCEILTLYGTDTLFLVNNIVDIYSTRLANCDASIDVNLFNCKVTALFECESKAESEQLKLLFDKISEGQPAVFYRKTKGMEDKGTNITYNNVKNTYIVDLLQIEKRKIIDEFLTLFGINNANTEKRERLNSDEVNSNNDELLMSVSYMRSNLADCVEKINLMFPNLNFNIKLKEFVGKDGVYATDSIER